MSTSNHDATRPNIDGQSKAHIEKTLRELLKGRDFVLLVDEYPRAWALTNAATPHEAKQVITSAMNKPWQK